ncbi:MAG TPA: BTAD domain-containing putative transcriptional regulator [Streptosporangiaceae bacterium]|nr:BTAD domain-containing putative transcriptional regulator [Streptosporangiaceae bacterium]
MAGEASEAAPGPWRGEVTPHEAAADAGLRISVFGPVSVSRGEVAISGRALGGRRARLALVALALSQAPLPADRLAAIIWPAQQPPTWPAALRGTIRALRASLAAVDGGGERVIVTTPAGYEIAQGVDVDSREAVATLRAASALADQGRHEAAVRAAEPLTSLSSEQLLPGEDASWLDSYRAQADAVALQALELVATSASALGDHHRAVAAGRRAVASNPLDERSHRVLISALQRGGDRAGVVLAYEACRHVLADQLGVDPDPETVRLYLTAIGAGDTAGSARLPQVASAFFGREAEVAELTTVLRTPGLVTVAGPGGVGKSRLALQVAVPAEFAGGKSWVSLAPVFQDELVASTVAVCLGLPVGLQDPAALLADHFAPLGRALLVIDGCEAVVDGAASLAASLLERCPTLSVLVTSRVRLAVEGEFVVAIEPLPFPGTRPDAVGIAWAGALASADFVQSPQVRLLADRVRAGGGQLSVDGATVPFILELCRRCGGLPLALELAAAQLAALSMADLLDQLPDLVADGQDWLRGVAMSSYALLDADEATVFRRFGVLDGQVALPLVRDVVADEAIPPVRIVRILRELTARGLLAVDRSGPRWRYHQDDDLHRLARDLLAESGEARPTMKRLADAVLAIVPAEPSAPPEPYLEPVGEVLTQVRSLLAAAIDGRLDVGTGLELGFRLHRYWAATNVSEGRFWLSRLLAAAVPSSPGQAHAAYALGYLSYWSGDTAAAIRELELAVQMLSGQVDIYAARALIYLGGLADDMDRGDLALDFVRRSIDAAAPFGASLQVAATMGMGCVLGERADAAAVRYATDAIELCRLTGSSELLAATLPTAATVCWQVGDVEQARVYVAEAMPLLAGSRRIARVVLLSVAAGIALADEDIDAAVDHGSVADTEATELGIEREIPLIRCILARALLVRGDAAGAAVKALQAIAAAQSLTYTFPMATCLETAALVRLRWPGGAAVGRTLLDAAAAIRLRGRRPGPVPLSAAVAEARSAVSAKAEGSALRDRGQAADAVELAVATLRGQPGAGGVTTGCGLGRGGAPPGCEC